MTTATELYSKREQRGWCLYDAANSVFATSAIALFLGPYVGSLARAAADASGYVHPLGVPILAEAFWGYLVGFSVFTQALLLPIVGALADYSRRKREWLAAMAAIGGVTASCMFFLQGSAYLLAAVLFIIANGCFGASIVVYNSFLPEIAPPEQRDGLSSKGWALGYAAGCLMLIAHLALLSRAQGLGLSQGMAVRLALLSTGVWWLIFTVPVFRALRNRGTPRRLPQGVSVLSMAFGQLLHTLKHMRQYPNTLKFLIAYLLYNDAIQTVFLQAAVFGKFELGLSDSQLALTILISNLVGIGGALAFNQLAARITPRRAIIVALVIWMSLLFYAYQFVHNVTEFFVMGAAAGLVMGGSQALSRSVFAQLVPHGKEAEYFSIYEVGDKGTSWLGPPVFALALQLTGSYRIAILSLLIFFVAGLSVLLRTDVKQGEWDVLKSA
ncbi:MAG: hypothetical protein RL328_1364 [Acidobacteriota bacterium]